MVNTKKVLKPKYLKVLKPKYLTKKVLKQKYLHLHDQIKKVHNSTNGDKKGELTLHFLRKISTLVHQCCGNLVVGQNPGWQER